MKQEIIGGKVFFVNELGSNDGYVSDFQDLQDLEFRIGKKWRKKFKRFVRKPLGRKSGLIRKIAKPLTIGTAVYFGTPLLGTKVLPALGGVGKTLAGKVSKTKTGAWWARLGKKVFRVVKTPSKKVISQEIKEENPVYQELVEKLPENVVSNSEVVNNISKNIPFPMPSGLPQTDVVKVSNKVYSEPLTQTYQVDKQIEVNKNGNVSVSKPMDMSKVLPIVASGVVLLKS